ncbi:dipeptide/oligopeptide/nickel ABC transporter permease/ATP-binding protein [Paenarthrobacter ilicis]|uniref:ABC-type dipeptide/oligopeptide/nickel transport system ATPase component/ABC-type dipeptide/oligopeptide/nickel transport system permease subunit n=1 Tax=Paenarthrobacter ilicis TaxID=43665 RepID=A0ABX0THB6_9MICC|nr:dipeptide/oligopeptide/nickel ABC transporter permease/ATP-binding protein [Paenarthrobacter ilicis]MBM7791881.1 ABC-type dipeptide/oligopeptide/nickel transport system ATPase component/ABC-type dipeptide/oligopeptide/nickel transport system permease subunit [Paenarthrobacter ilicis]NIJ01494.1 ABC-type dipeptide/oligopeptide/nickel transport system ATPase component/ABC-type dipeptide/oligopeptide/nickel transport system permease subunit [Paenarthrobacter ilicis]
MSDSVDTAAVAVAASKAGQSGTVVRSSVTRRLLKNPLGIASLLILATIAFLAIFAPMLAPFEENFANISKTLAAPDSVNILGTDSAGRDTWSRLLFGAQLTLLSALLCAGVAIAIGLPAGLIAGYYGGKFEGISNWVVSILMSLPGLIVLLTIRAAFGPSVWISMIAFGILISPSYFRLTRTAVQSVRNELYVDAARVSGLSDVSIVARHIFSVVRAPIIIQTAAIAGVAIGIQSGLEFLGLGDPTKATWGVMLSEGFKNVYLTPILLVWPALAMALTIGGLVLLGNAIRDALEDGEKIKHRKKRGSVSAASSTERTTPEPAKARQSRKSVAAVESGTEHHLVKVTNLGVGYPQADGSIKKVVDDVSFHVDRGEILGIVGESGSGKSQTAFSILGLLPDNARIVGGSIQFDGNYTVAPGEDRVSQERLTKLRGKRISYIPQEPMSNLDPAFTIGYQLVTPMVRVLGISKAEARTRAIKLLTDVGIANPERTFAAYPHEVSGGMAQRVLIAGAISCEPDLVIADEPTTALDVTVQADVLDLLRELQQRLNIGVVLVTHNFGVVADLCDRVAVMQNGRLVEEGPVREILRNPKEQYTQTLLGSMLEGKTPMTMLVSTPGSAAQKEPVA